MERTEKSGSINIRGTLYLYSLHAESDSLQISFEEKETGKKWQGDFTDQYIESMTQKANSFKRFPIFTKMLISSLESSSDSVIIDLLTAQELAMFRNWRSQNTSADPNPKVTTKRYLILTYTVEFDRVHYPLPLAFQETPDPEALQRTISRLRFELESIKNAAPEEGGIIKIYQENSQLKQRLQILEQNLTINSAQRKENPEIENLINENKILEDENEKLKIEGNKEVRILKKKNEDLQIGLDSLKQQMDGIINQLESENDERMEVKEIKTKYTSLCGMLDKSAKNEKRLNEEINKVQIEIEKLTECDGKQKERIKQLESELQTAIKARNAKNVGSSPNRISRSPAARSPGYSRVSNSPKTATTNSRTSSRPGSDRIPQRVTQPYRGRSPGTSPASSINRSPLNSRQRTPPNRRDSPPATRSSPNTRASPNARNSPNTRNSYNVRNSPNTRNSPNSRTSYNARNSPNARNSYNSRNSPKAGYQRGGVTDENNPIRKRSPKSSGPAVSDIDARLSRLQELLKKAKS
ncbi:unnamed protein product [Blepharisma stoltei]|uniref:Uncharacterized protein n=1 Tax=Blepharisma stoltei TaxID=1481888 RepID=A0AAU9JTN6_9CILI|nr:unnamed protein product [Blepharisma stoltei]